VLALAGVDVVANDLAVSAEQPVLVLTGPNAGGKTIALKTIGLCAALVRAGCYVPADRGSRVDWFDGVLADIGDQQTVHEGLSSFSAHLTTLREMLSAARPGILLLLDEIASGTDPTQGGALARAFIERFADVGARVIVTTHYAQVKAMAAADSRVGVSAMEYADGRPTYRIVAGLAGESHALSAAEHVGLDRALIERARALMDEGERALGDALAELEHERERSRSLTRRVERMAAELDTRERAVAEREERQRAGARKLEREAAAEFTERVRAAEREIRRIVAELQRAPGPRAAATARRRLADACEDIATAVAENEPSREPQTLAVGDRVNVRSLGASGEVLSIEGQRLEVRVGSMLMHVEATEVDKVGGPASALPLRGDDRGAPAVRKQRGKWRATEEVAGGGSAAPAVRQERNTLDLRGVRVGDGLRMLDEFLDAAVLAGEDAVFVLHGHGTGAMKSAVREALGRSAYVEDSRPAEPEQGGDALTVARLRG
jgi:DNA mismatch repair protein MutS2